ncbi:MAG TPA: MFS transporter, partial [Phytomonospora sp.]
LSIITTSFAEGEARNRALLIYSGTAAGGFAVGLVVGGLLTAVDWRWVFGAPVVMSAIVLAAALALIPASPRPKRDGRRVDLAGGITVTVGIVLLVLGVERAAHVGAGTTALTIGAGLAAFAAFAVIERRSAFPLVRLGILRSGALIRANLGTLLMAAAFFGFQFLAVLYMQELRGWSTLETSFALLVMGIDVVLAPTLTPWLVKRYGTGRVIFGGLAAAAVAYALFLPIASDWTYAAMFPSLLLIGLSFSLAYGPLTIAATDGIAEEEQGLAGGLLYTSFQFGAALGLSTVTAVNVAATEGTGVAAMLGGYRAALVVPLALAVVAAAVSAFGLRRAQVPEPVAA